MRFAVGQIWLNRTGARAEVTDVAKNGLGAMILYAETGVKNPVDYIAFTKTGDWRLIVSPCRPLDAPRANSTTVPADQ
jgi:hypothetical protein